jgi:hypothetical protein
MGTILRDKRRELTADIAEDEETVHLGDDDHEVAHLDDDKGDGVNGRHLGWFSQGVSFLREFWFTIALFFVFSIVSVFAYALLRGVWLWGLRVLGDMLLYLDFLTVYLPLTCIAYFCVVAVVAVVYCLK